MDTLVTVLAIMLICPAMMIMCRLLRVIGRVLSHRQSDRTDNAEPVRPEYN